MKRAVIAMAWLIGATVPLLLATVFLVGCCVLPFHRVMHKLMPVCHLAANLLSGGESEHREAQVPEKKEPVKRVATTESPVFRLLVSHAVRRLEIASPAAARSVIALGAVRCDDDVGLHLLDRTLLI